VAGGRGAVRIEPYSEAWADAFFDEAQRLEGVFAGIGARIEHIGSTSVPGLAAKPIIDILIGLDDLRDAERRVAAMEEIGYGYVPEYESMIPDRRYFRRPRARPRTHHVHCVVRDGALWRGHVAFRDRLRAFPDEAREYEGLKRSLAGQRDSDREAYQNGKASFIRDVLHRVGVP
jgi:GrpB-like predicted nucleotidyltransferase (UPF0157 family)